MQYRKFGKTNESVSVLGLGTMRLPIVDGDYGNVDVPAALRLVRHAVDHGLNYIDTSWPYHSTDQSEGGASEPFVGQALQEIGRDKVFVATKLPIWAVASREDMDSFLDRQLERLKTDYVDFYLVHNIMEPTWKNMKALGLADFLDKALQSGKIRHAGFSFHDTPALFRDVLDYYDWSFCQHVCNYFDVKFQAGLAGIDAAAARGLGFVAMECLLGGMLADQLPQAARDVFAATDPTRSPAAWALRWVWNRPQTSLLLSGMNSMEQLDENLRLADEAKPNMMTPEELEAVDKVRSILKSKGEIPCTECGKCACPKGVDIPQVFTIYNSNRTFDVIPISCHNYGLMVAPSGHGADKCDGCRECEPLCPEHIAIADTMRKVAARFAEAKGW